VHGEGMLVAKKAAASDTAHQWSSFAPQNRRCLHGRRGQPLKARADAGNEVAEVEKMRNTRWRGAIGPRQVTRQAISHTPAQSRLAVAAQGYGPLACINHVASPAPHGYGLVCYQHLVAQRIYQRPPLHTP
jgi:hypothetical protein